MQYVYLIIAVITSGLSGVCYKKVSQVSNNRIESAVLPIAWFVPLAAGYGLSAIFSDGLDTSFGVVFPAIIAAISAVMCAFALLESMKSNSYSLAIIIVNLSFVFPIIFSIIFLGEATHVLQFIGMLIAILVILILNNTKGKSSKIALLLAVLSSLGNGMIDFSIKIQQHLMPGKGIPSFFFLTYLFATIICLGIWAVAKSGRKKICIFKHKNNTFWANAIFIAICNGLCFGTISLLTGWMNAAAEFTVITSLSIIISLGAGWLRMKEKIGKKEIISLVFCTAAIVCQYLNLV